MPISGAMEAVKAITGAVAGIVGEVGVGVTGVVVGAEGGTEVAHRKEMAGIGSTAENWEKMTTTRRKGKLLKEEKEEISLCTMDS